MPGFMPPGTIEPKEDPPDFGEDGDDAEYTKVQLQTDLNASEDVGKEDVEVNLSEEDADMDAGSSQTR